MPRSTRPGTSPHRLAATNWTGLAGAWLADIILQTIGIAAFFLPIVFGRIGLCWMRQRPAGSAKARCLGLALWIVFAPAALGLLPRTLLWRHALPIEGVTGRLLADAMVHYLNLPGATIVLALMVAVSLYLATTFTLHTAQRVDRSPLLLPPPTARAHPGTGASSAPSPKPRSSGLADQPEPLNPPSPAIASTRSNRPPKISNASAARNPPRQTPCSAASSAGWAVCAASAIRQSPRRKSEPLTARRSPALRLADHAAHQRRRAAGHPAQHRSCSRRSLRRSARRRRRAPSRGRRFDPRSTP